MVNLPKEVKLHEGNHPSGEYGEAEGLDGKLEGRKYVLGVFYPSNGYIYIDNLLVSYPSYAKTTVSAEIAHSVDEFLPMSDEMRNKIMTLIHGGDTTAHGHSWWENMIMVQNIIVW